MTEFFQKRYGEVLLIRLGESGPEATVYNTFPLNDCPADWLMDRVDKDMTAPWCSRTT